MKEEDVVNFVSKFLELDDAAVVEFNGKFLSITTDTLVFKTDVPDEMTPYQVGKKCVVMNLSDICAMNSTPKWFLCSAVFPRDYKYFRKVLEGVKETCDLYSVDFVGGDTNEGDFSLTGTAIGVSDSVLRRSGARKGDKVCVTGDLGRVYAGFRDLKNATQKIKKKIFEPEIKILKIKGNSCIDVSDGLSSELWHLSNSSKVRIDVFSEKIPIHRDVVKVAERFSENPVEYAMKSGEEYELLFTTQNPEENEFDFTVIGNVCKGRGVFLDSKPLKKMGWKHFHDQKSFIL